MSVAQANRARLVELEDRVDTIERDREQLEQRVEGLEAVAEGAVASITVYLVADHAAKLLERTGTPMYGRARALRRGALSRLRAVVEKLAEGELADEGTRETMKACAQLTAELMELRT